MLVATTADHKYIQQERIRGVLVREEKYDSTMTKNRVITRGGDASF